MDYLERFGQIILLSSGENQTKILTYSIILLVLLILSAFFAASEMAISSSNKVKLKLMADDKVKGARKALSILENFDKTLSTILICNNLVNIAMATIGLLFFSIVIKNEDTASLVSTIVITIIVLIGGEILPKSLGKAKAEKLVIKVAAIFILLNWIFIPLNVVLIRLRKILIKEETIDDSVKSESELEVILDSMEEHGVIHEDEVDLIENVLDLNDITVSDIMTHRVNIVAVEINDSLEKIKEVFFKQKFSRIPVYENDKDNVVGVLYERDFFTKLIEQKDFRVKDILRPVKYVSKEMKVDALIHELQEANMHMAIVSDEWGGTSGLVTLEDALEEIVGEIYDEHDDVATPMLKELEDGTYLVSAGMEIEDLFEHFNIEKYPNTTYNNVGGWIYELCEGVPKVGKQLNYVASYTKFDSLEEEYFDYKTNFSFEIVEVDERRIVSVLIKVETIISNDDK